MKRSLSLVLAVCLVFTMFTGVMVPGTGAVTYTDVAKDFWAYDPIYYLTDKGILEGDGTGKFRPTDDVTHIEFIKMIVATFNLMDTTTVNYTNVPDWAREGRYLEKAAAQGFLLDEYTRDFDFTEELTREEAVALVMRYLDLDDEYAASSSSFPDYSDITPAYRTYALIAKGAGIIQGDENGKYQPERVLTRSEALQILYAAAGAIYDRSANKAESGAAKTNATINKSVNLSDITFTGNVYITESVDTVYFTDCYISGTLYVRGNTEVTLYDTIASNVIVNGNRAEIELEGETEISTVDVNATSSIVVSEDSVIEKLLYNDGSKNSTLSGKGAVTNIAIQDDGISSTDVSITEYYIYRGYTATFDGIEYEAGSGKPLQSNITSATVSGSTNYYTSNSSNITINVTANTAGTVYAAAWPKTTTALTANEIKNVSSSYLSSYYGTYKTVTANVSNALTISVPGSYENYNVGIVFLPTGVTSAANMKPYYNKNTITGIAAAMGTDVPSTSTTINPTWTLSTSATGTSLVCNALVLNFDQLMYYKSTTYPYGLSSLTSLTSTQLANLFTVYEGASRVSFTATCSNSLSKTIVTLQPTGGVTKGKSYTVSFANLVNANGVAPSTTSSSIVAGATTSAYAPTLTSSSGSSSVDSNDYIQVGFPTGVSKIAYTVTVDGRQVDSGTFNNSYSSTYARIYLNRISGSVITVSAWAVDSYGSQISEITTQTYYMGYVPYISVDGNQYYGANNTVYVNTSYYINTASVPSGYTATYAINGYAVSASEINGSHTETNVTYTMTLTPYYGTGSSVTTSITVLYGYNNNGGGSGTVTPSASEPEVWNDGHTTKYESGWSNSVGTDSVSLQVKVPNSYGVTYYYSVNGGYESILTPTTVHNITVTIPNYGVDAGSGYLKITAKSSTGITISSWTYNFDKK